MKGAIDIINYARQKTDEIILFHSGNGKDSIVLLDLLTKYFKRVVPVYMYIIPNLDFANKYIGWSQRKYGVQFVQTPHFAVYSYIKTGFMGIKQDPKQRCYTLSDIDKYVKEKLGIEWSCYGMKQNDSLNRRLMLRTYELEGICEKTSKIYPLTHWSNKDCVNYIKAHNLMQNELSQYCAKGQSTGMSVNNLPYLLFSREFYPNDYKRICETYPLAETLVNNYDEATETSEYEQE